MYTGRVSGNLLITLYCTGTDSLCLNVHACMLHIAQALTVCVCTCRSLASSEIGSSTTRTTAPATVMMLPSGFSQSFCVHVHANIKAPMCVRVCVCVRLCLACAQDEETLSTLYIHMNKTIHAYMFVQDGEALVLFKRIAEMRRKVNEGRYMHARQDALGRTATCEDDVKQVCMRTCACVCA